MMAMTTSNSSNVNAVRRGMRVSSLVVLNALAVVLLLPSCRKSSPLEGKSPGELETMLKSPQAAVQAQGALGLSQLGAKAAPAVPALTEALKSPDALVRQNAALAL